MGRFHQIENMADPLRLQVTDRISAALGDRQIAMDFESVIYEEIKGSDVDYAANLGRLLFLIEENQNLLISLARRSSAAEAFASKDSTLLAGTLAARRHEQMDAHEAKFENMLQEKFEALRDDAGAKETDGLLQCGRCGSSNVTFNQKQTRSADEGMTLLCVCLKCSFNWVMN